MKFFIFTSMIVFANSVFAAFDRPESVYVDNKYIYVSNMSGPGNLKDGIGWISKLNKKGKVLQEQWVKGLNAPKGLAVYKGQLYTSDIDEVVMIDLKKGSLQKISVPGAKLLNDMAVDPVGNLYISDTFGGKIFKLDQTTQKVSELVTLKDAPNGLLLVGDMLYIAGYGKPKADGTGMEDGPKGGLSSYNLTSGELKSIIPDIGKMDGIQMLKDGKVVISVKLDEALYWVDLKEGRITGSLRGSSSLATFTDVADMGYDSAADILYVPNTKTHDIQKIRLKKESE
jgi:outer membrane protein assembly factor BamB